MDLAACVSACVVTAVAVAAGPDLARETPARFRGAGPGPESGGGGGGAGAGEGRGGGAITPSLSPAGSTRASCGARSTPGARPACAFSFSTSSSGLPAAAAAAPARPSALPPARASGAARPRAGWLLPGGAAARAARPRRAEGGAPRRSRGRAAEGRTQAAGPRCAGPPCRARPGAAVARGRPGDRLSGLPVAFSEAAVGTGPSVQTGDRWCGGSCNHAPWSPPGADGSKYADLPAGSLLKPATGSERGGGQHGERTKEEAQPPPSAPSVPTPYPAAQEAPGATLFLLLLAGSALAARAGRAPQAPCSPRHPPPGRAP